MKFFTISLTTILFICAYFWISDDAGSGMVWPTVLVAALLGGVLLYNTIRNGNPFDDNTQGR